MRDPQRAGRVTQGASRGGEVMRWGVCGAGQGWEVGTETWSQGESHDPVSNPGSQGRLCPPQSG